MSVRRSLIAVAVLAAFGGCFVSDVPLVGKACDDQHSCEEGYSCSDVGDGGVGTCVADNDAGP